jgi:hypothetical protein
LYKVVSTRLFGGRTRLRVYARERPDGSFAEAAPDLEDVYFTTIKGLAESA